MTIWLILSNVYDSDTTYYQNDDEFEIEDNDMYTNA